MRLVNHRKSLPTHIHSKHTYIYCFLNFLEYYLVYFQISKIFSAYMSLIIIIYWIYSHEYTPNTNIKLNRNRKFVIKLLINQLDWKLIYNLIGRLYSEYTYILRWIVNFKCTQSTSGYFPLIFFIKALTSTVKIAINFFSPKRHTILIFNVTFWFCIQKYHHSSIIIIFVVVIIRFSRLSYSIFWIVFYPLVLRCNVINWMYTSLLLRLHL